MPGQMRRLAEEIAALDRSGAPDPALDEAFLRMQGLARRTTTDYYLAILKEALRRAPARARERYLDWMRGLNHREEVRRLLREIIDEPGGTPADRPEAMTVSSSPE